MLTLIQDRQVAFIESTLSLTGPDSVTIPLGQYFRHLEITAVVDIHMHVVSDSNEVRPFPVVHLGPSQRY